MNKKYDYLIIGAGLFGSVFAQQATERGKKCLVIDRREHIGGNLYTKNVDGIHVHQYGAHIFHTNDSAVWNYVQRFASFNNYINAPVARYKNEIYSLPFNMYTFNKMWGIITPQEAESIINRQKKEIQGQPFNLEEQAISMVGRDVYERLVKEYTEKQWGRSCDELPSFIIRRLPVRFTYDNNYFDARYQGIPVGGYTPMIERMLTGCDVQTGIDYLDKREELDRCARKTIYTGALDAYYNYQFGKLAYRSLRFEEELLDTDNYQGNAVVNYTDRETPFTRIIEHKWFEFGKNEKGESLPKTVITREYSLEYQAGREPFYPVNDDENEKVYQKYRELAAAEENKIFGGRLADYRYYDMDVTIARALDCVNSELANCADNH